MPAPSDQLKKNYSFFHANSKLLHRESSLDLNYAMWSSGHVVQTTQMLASSLPWYLNTTDLDNWIINNPNILKKYDQFSLSSVAGTSNEIWYINDSSRGNEWMKPIITPELVTNTQNDRSYCYNPYVYKADGTRLYSWDGMWWIDPFQGIVKFGDGYNPGDLGWGTPKITCYVYIGPTLYDKTLELTPSVYKYNSDYHGGASTTHTVNHNLNSMYLTVNVVVEDPVTLEWHEDNVGITYNNQNTITLELTESCNIRASIQLIK